VGWVRGWRGVPGAVVVVVAASVGVVACGHPTGGTAAGHPSSAAPSPGPSVPTSVPPGGDCVAATLAALPLEARVGQLLMIGTPIANPANLVPSIRKYRLGGVFLQGRSTASAATLRQQVQALQQAGRDATGLGVEVALDQEGGLVQTMSGADFPTIASAQEQGTWDAATLRTRTADWAHRLAAAGITMDLAPVADTVPAGTAASNPPIGALHRQYGSNPDAVARDIATVVGAAQSAGVLTTLKHFPGLGRVRTNTDTSADSVDNTTTVDDPYLRPFAEGIRAGTGAVMVSSAKYPRLDAQAIAAYSSAVITGLLRNRLKFTGVVISDDLGAAKAAASVPVGERAVRFVEAGGDLVLTIRPADAGPMATALVAAAQQSPAVLARVADAATHVLRAKARAGLLPCAGRS
jgi:beta-N-acetylhexosaminidase